jgi:hypothetical protein
MTQNSKTKQETIDFMPYWKREEGCYSEITVTGKDIHGKKATTTWPRDEPQSQVMYKLWLKKIQDPDTGQFYKQRDKDGNIIKGTVPKHIVKQIVRVRTIDDKEYLYSNGYLLGYDVMGDPVREICSNPETWQRTEFEYRKQYDPRTNSVKAIPVGPNHVYTVYEMPFNEKNLKQLYEKRITPELLRLLKQTRLGQISFSIKDERTSVVREVRDATGIEHKTLELFMKPFDYLANEDYLTPEQKAQARQRAIDMGLLPREAQVQHIQQQQQQGQASQGQGTKPPSGTYS